VALVWTTKSPSRPKRSYKSRVKFKLNTKVTAGEVHDAGVKVSVEAAKGGKEESLDADVVLVAIGRRPYTSGLGLDNINLETDDRGRLIIDQEYRTKIPHIRAIGDCTFGPMLAHKAEEEAVAAIEYIHKGHGHVNYGAIPSVMYTHPEVAWVGQNEQELKEAGIKYKNGTFPFSANSRAKTNLDTEGMVKFLADAQTDRILGIHIIGPNAGEMIAEGTLALEYGASSEGESKHSSLFLGRILTISQILPEHVTLILPSLRRSRRLLWPPTTRLFTTRFPRFGPAFLYASAI